MTSVQKQRGKTMPEYIAEVVQSQYGEIKILREKLTRCKDCKYWLPHRQYGFDEDNEEYHDYCERLVPDDDYYAFTRNADDFCSRAKRKEE